MTRIPHQPPRASVRFGWSATRTKPWASAQRLMLIATLLLLVGGGYRFYLQRVAAQARLAEWQAEQRLEERLNRVVEMKFEGEPTLEQWLAEWSRQAGVAGEVNSLKRPREAQQPIALQLKPLAARDALQSLARVYGFGWTLQKDGSVTLYPRDFVDGPSEIRSYALPENQLVVDQWREARRNVNAFMFDASPDTPGRLLLQGSRTNQLQAEVFLRGMTLAVEHAESLANSSVTLDPKAWQPILIDDDPAAMQRALALIDRPVTIDVTDLTLRAFARHLTDVLDHPVFVDPGLQIDRDRRSNPDQITYQSQDVPLSQVLERVLRHSPLRAVPVASGRALALVPQFNRSNSRQEVCYAYPVHDLSPASLQVKSGGFDHEPLLNVITNLVDGEWYGHHGESLIGGGPCGPVLVVTKDISVHRQLQNLLATIRTARSGLAGIAARKPLSADALQLKAKLAQPAELIYLNVPIKEVIADLRRRFDLEIELNELTAAVGIASDTSIWCHLPAQPLGENLQRMLEPSRLTYVTDEKTVHVLAQMEALKIDDRRHFQYEVYNLRSLQHPGLNAPQAVEALLLDFAEDFDWRRMGGRGRAIGFNELLILEHSTQALDRTRRVMQAVQQQYFLTAQEVRARSRQDRSAPFLADPLLLKAAEDFAREQELRNKLQEKVSPAFKVGTVLELLEDLAREHQLPIVYSASRDTDLMPEDLVILDVENETLQDVLQRLLPEESTKRWIVSHNGTLQTWEPDFLPEALRRERWLFNVNDLLLPEGKLLAEELLRGLENSVAPTPHTYTDAKLELHLGKFLGVYATRKECETLQRTLHEFRAGILPVLWWVRDQAQISND